MLQWLYTYVASVCFKCFVYFSDICCKCFYQDVDYVSHICLQVFLSRCYIYFAIAFQVFLGIFASVLDACFKCFIFLQTYVAKISSGILDVLKVDLVLYMLQCDSPTTTTCCSYWGALRACGKRRDGALRGCGQSLPGVGVQQPRASVRTSEH